MGITVFGCSGHWYKNIRLRSRKYSIRLRVMSATEELIAEVDRFLAETGMAPTTLGQKAVRNWKLVNHLRAGGGTGLKTADRLRFFMRSYSDRSRAA